MSEMDKLEKYLLDNHFVYWRKKWLEGEQIIVYDGYCSEETRKWDAICNKYSYGYKDGLLEIMGNIVPEDADDSVIGCLTAKEVIEYIERGRSNNV